VERDLASTRPLSTSGPSAQSSSEPARGRHTAHEVIETGVPGLVVARAELGGSWRLVHRPSGLLVSRSITHRDPLVLVRLARRLGPLADWSRREIPVPGPALRQAVEQAAVECGVTLAPEVTLPTHRTEDRSQVAERDRELLRRVLRRIHTAVPPGMLASAIADLDPEERARLRALLTEDASWTGSVVKPLAPPRPARPEGPEEGPRTPRSGTPSARRAPSPPRPGSATG
jgi:hypothetical protein